MYLLLSRLQTVLPQSVTGSSDIKYVMNFHHHICEPNYYQEYIFESLQNLFLDVEGIPSSI